MSDDTAIGQVKITATFISQSAERRRMSVYDNSGCRMNPDRKVRNWLGPATHAGSGARWRRLYYAP
jgi:hypothetical protein